MNLQVEQSAHPDGPDVSIQFTDAKLHHCIGLSSEEAERLLADLEGAVE